MTLQEIENSIASMSPEELAKFRAWFSSFDAKRFDERIEADASSGRLDDLANAAIREHEAGKSTEL